MQGTEPKKKVMFAGNQPSPGPGETLTMEKQKEKSVFWFQSPVFFHASMQDTDNFNTIRYLPIIDDIVMKLFYGKEPQTF